jgi:hypothetical protein
VFKSRIRIKVLNLNFLSALRFLPAADALQRDSNYEYFYFVMTPLFILIKYTIYCAVRLVIEHARIMALPKVTVWTEEVKTTKASS